MVFHQILYMNLSLGLLDILTLFQTKTCHFPLSISYVASTICIHFHKQVLEILLCLEFYIIFWQLGISTHHRFTAHFSFSIIHLKMKRKHSFYAHQVPLGSSQIYKNLLPFSHQNSSKPCPNGRHINVYTSSSYWVIIASLQPLHQIKSTIPCIKSGGYYPHFLLQLSILNCHIKKELNSADICINNSLHVVCFVFF